MYLEYKYYWFYQRFIRGGIHVSTKTISYTLCGDQSQIVVLCDNDMLAIILPEYRIETSWGPALPNGLPTSARFQKRFQTTQCRLFCSCFCNVLTLAGRRSTQFPVTALFSGKWRGSPWDKMVCNNYGNILFCLPHIIKHHIAWENISGWNTSMERTQSNRLQSHHAVL